MIELSELLEPHRNLIEAWLRPAIWIHIDQVGTGKIGQSRISGTPDLPQSLPWPKHSERYLDYLLQINLAELPDNPRTPKLPRSGMIWLYEEWNTPTVQQLFLWCDDEILEPTELMAESYYSEEVEPHTLNFRNGFDLPHWYSEPENKLCAQLQGIIAGVDPDDDKSVDAMEEVWEVVHEGLNETRKALKKGAMGHLFGWAGGIGKDIQKDAVVNRLNSSAIYENKKRKQMDLSDSVSWKNLLTVNSNNDIGLYIGDAGYTAVLIHSDDLEKGNFDRCYVTNQSS